MSETPFFFESGARSLFGVLHQPKAAPRGPAFVFVHPFGEEKLWAHRVFVSFARQLASVGHTVLRFDCMGSGDSDGEFSECSIASMLSDVRAATDVVRSKSGSALVSLMGLRLGASVAALAAEQLAGVYHLILWAPVVDGGRYAQDLLRINLTTQMATYREIREDREAMVATMARGGTVNVDGYEIAYPFFAETSAIQLGAGAKSHQGPCLVAQIDRRASEVGKDLQALASTYPNGTAQSAQEEPFWKEIAAFYDRAPALFAVTADWLQQHP